LLVFGLGARAVAIYESFGDTDAERRQVLEQVLDEAHLRRLAEVDNRYRRLWRSGRGAS
jgi:hypothetical protein